MHVPENTINKTIPLVAHSSASGGNISLSRAMTAFAACKTPGGRRNCPSAGSKAADKDADDEEEEEDEKEEEEEEEDAARLNANILNKGLTTFSSGTGSTAVLGAVYLLS